MKWKGRKRRDGSNESKGRNRKLIESGDRMPWLGVDGGQTVHAYLMKSMEFQGGCRDVCSARDDEVK